MSNKNVAAKYGVPQNTWSTWVKNNERRLDSLEKVSSNKWQKLRTSNSEMVAKAIFNRFLSMRRQNFPLSAAIIQEKALKFAK